MFPLNSRFLLVDDSSSMRKMIKKMLMEIGYTEFVEADNGRLAMIALRVSHSEQKPIDVIISDWNMPTMTGLDFLKYVRSEEKIKHTPFLLVTAEADQSSMDTAKEHNVSSYLTKPFKKENLEEHLKLVFDKIHGQKAA